MKPELETLWLAWRADELDAIGDERLAALIAEDPAARDAILTDLELEQLLVASRVDDAAFTRALRERLAAEDDGARFVATLRGRLARRAQQRWYWAAAAVAAAAVIILALPPTDDGAAPPPPTIVESDPAPSTTAIAGTEIAPTSDARYRTDPAQRLVVLDHGGVSCAVEPGTGGLRVRTPVAEVEVLGTRFRVDADARVTAVAVDHGRVRISRDDGAALVLTAGLRCSVTADGPLLPRLATPGSALLIADTLTDRAAQALAATLRDDGWRVELRDHRDPDLPPEVELVIPLRAASSGLMERPSHDWDALPVLCLDPSINRWLGLSDQRRDTYLDDRGQGIVLAPSTEAWAAGLSGTVTVQPTGSNLYWAEAAAGATVLATVADHPERAAMLMTPRTQAHPPRLFLGINPAADPNREGWALLRGAAAWLVAEHRSASP